MNMKRFNRRQFLKSAGVVTAGISAAPIIPQLSMKENESKSQTYARQTFHIQMGTSGQILWNVADNVNVWDYASSWHEAMEQAPKDYFSNRLPFVKYVQFMTAAGGNEQRDLFKEPLNRTVSDDYAFAPLIRGCRNVIRQGLIPHLKLGNVPLKYSKNYKIGTFGVNVLPPDDYRQWHGYIKALIRSLVNEFGLEQVRRWRFGCVTEYENSDWFSVDNNPEITREAYFKLYDYTVDAVQQVLGENICIGAHSMTCSEGLWDEREFIAHCAHGINYYTGKTGSRLCFLAASFYEMSPGKPNQHTFSQSIDILRKTAEKEGFDNLFYGVDEGRILNGLDGKPLYPRAVGYTWQAAFDARLYRMAYDNQIDYFSHWSYTTNNLNQGILSVSAQTSALFYKMNGAVRLAVKQETDESSKDGETGAIAAWNRELNKVYLLFYAYSNSVHSQGSRNILCQLDGIEKSGRVTATRTLISNNSNFFDEWLADWKKFGISEDNFAGWSSDSFVIDPSLLPKERLAYYESCAALKPETGTLTVEAGTLNIRTTIPVHGVLLYEIELASE
jgi:xylan 1,4-beta-xylosidase